MGVAPPHLAQPDLHPVRLLVRPERVREELVLVVGHAVPEERQVVERLEVDGDGVELVGSDGASGEHVPDGVALAGNSLSNTYMYFVQRAARARSTYPFDQLRHREH